MSDDKNDDPAVDDPIVELRQSDLNKMIGKARQEARAAKATAATAPAPMTPESIAAIVGATIAAMKPPEGPAPKPAAAPQAPSGAANPFAPNSQGLIDLFALDHNQLNQLGPRGVRKALDDIAKAGRALMNTPRIPEPHTKKGNR